MSSNAALSAARRRRSIPLNAPAGTMGGPGGPGGPPANRILQRMGQQQPQQPQQPQARMATPQMQQRGPLQQQQQQQQQRGTLQQQQQQQQQMKRMQPPQMQQQKQQSAPLPPLPPPNKNAGQLYGIPLHPLIMFQTHDNKLNEHDLSITECFDQLKEFEGRLIVVEGNGGVYPAATAPATVIAEAVPGGVSDLNELMNDGVFINGVVDNIMATTNFASIVENIIPLKEENEMLKQRISEQEIRSDQMQQFIQQLEERLRNIENELAQPYEETSAPAPVIRIEEVAAASATESEVVDGNRDDETLETLEKASIAEIVAESINDIILSSSTLSSSITSSTHM
jgi:hypothetical protein